MKNNIKVERAKRDMTQSELANLLGVSTQTVCKWENDISSCPVTKLLSLREIFGVSLDYIVGGDPEHESTSA